MDLYYTPPKQNIFDEVKKKAIEIWSSYDDEFGYATKKINAIKDIGNVGDNFMFMVSMFDNSNQARLRHLISNEARQEIYVRLRDGGMPEQLNMFRE